MTSQQRPRVIIIGAGFGGLHTAQELANKPVDVLLVDRNNFHTFTPLLYQVATCGLDPSEIAYPVRSIFRNKANIRFMLGEVIDIDYLEKQVTIKTNGKSRQEVYDYLVVATGSVTNYFGNADLAHHAFGLKNLRDAIDLRNHILRQFEKAAWTDDLDYRAALTTLVVVGGGPTGLETAGALYELYNHVLKHEFDLNHNLSARVILVEATDRLLIPYAESLQQAALDQLQSLGVEVVLNARVESVAEDHVVLADGQVIPTHTLIWSAGVKASPIAAMLDVPLERGSLVPITPTLQVIGRDSIYAIGDTAYLKGPGDKPYPMVIPVAKQQGILSAKNILHEIHGEALESFQYTDRGIMATIGRSRAVAWIFYRIRLTGYLAWLAWLFLHLVTLLGFRNRVVVFLSWVWNYLTFDRSVRLILDRSVQRIDAEEESVPKQIVEMVENT